MRPATLEMMQLFADEVMPHFREDAHVDETAGVGPGLAGRLFFT